MNVPRMRGTFIQAMGQIHTCEKIHKLRNKCLIIYQNKSIKTQRIRNRKQLDSVSN